MKNTMRNLIVGTGILVLFTHTAHAKWVQTNTPHAGSIKAFAMSDSNIFAGTDSGGVLLFANNGTRWTAVNSGLTNDTVLSLAVSGNNIFAGTTSGVFLSTNNGTRWTEVNNGIPYSCVTSCMKVWSLAASGSNIFAGIDFDGSCVIFLSTNNGTSWTAVDSTLGGTGIVNFLAVNGSNICALYNTYCLRYEPIMHGYVPVGCGHIFLSANYGTSWTKEDLSTNPGFFSALAVSGSNIFAGTGSNVYLSTNNGTNWTMLNSYRTPYTVTALAVSGNTVFAGDDWGFVYYLPTNNVGNWTEVDSGLPPNAVTALAVSGDYLFAGTDTGGIWRRPLSEMVGVVQRVISKSNSSGFNFHISKNGIVVLLPEAMNNGAITVGLFNIAGKRIYSATHRAYNGTLNIPVSGLSTGTYLMSIRGNTTTLSSPFVVTK